MSGPAELRLKVLSREEVSLDTVSLVLVREGAVPLPAAEPGQYLTFVLDLEGQPRPVIRCYSLSDAPNGETYRITVKRVKDGLASAYMNDRVRPGDVLRAQPPIGFFTLIPGESDPLVFLAGGIGITPLLSMLEGLVAAGAERDVHLVFGVRNGAEHPFKARLEWLSQRYNWLHLHVAYSRPSDTDREGVDYHSAGRVNPDLLQRILPQAERPYRFYVCGPAPMMDALTTGLADLGVPESRIHVEAFGKATIKPLTRRLNKRLAANAKPIQVRFAREGKSAEWDPATGNLLEFAMSQGVFLPFACAAGHCGTCSSALLSGAVEYPIEPQFRIRDGQCLPCIAVPTEDVELDV